MVERYRPNRRKPFRYLEGGLTRNTLLRALQAEYRRGNSESKLYVALLARAVFNQEPRFIYPAGETGPVNTELLKSVGICVPDDAKTKIKSANR
jgi:hypothetical protein